MSSTLTPNVYSLGLTKHTVYDCGFEFVDGDNGLQVIFGAPLVSGVVPKYIVLTVSNVGYYNNNAEFNHSVTTMRWYASSGGHMTRELPWLTYYKYDDSSWKRSTQAIYSIQDAGKEFAFKSMEMKTALSLNNAGADADGETHLHARLTIDFLYSFTDACQSMHT